MRDYMKDMFSQEQAEEIVCAFQMGIDPIVDELIGDIAMYIESEDQQLWSKEIRTLHAYMSSKFKKGVTLNA